MDLAPREWLSVTANLSPPQRLLGGGGFVYPLPSLHIVYTAKEHAERQQMIRAGTGKNTKVKWTSDA